MVHGFMNLHVDVQSIDSQMSIFTQRLEHACMFLYMYMNVM